jgi:hypothetical protein
MRTRNALAAIALAIVMVGCATLNNGSDAFVVRVEQSETAANATFDLVLHVDHADRGFWRTNAPAFHSFCEWLRTPQAYGAAGSSVPRCVAMQLNLDDLKLAYKASKTTGTSNALWSSWMVLNTAITQSTSWSNIVTTPTH